MQAPFSRDEAVALWSRLVAGWAEHLNTSGTRLMIDGIHNNTETGGSYEGVTRMLWGLGSWLAYPDRPATLTWDGKTYDLEQLTYRALVNGCDANVPDSWHQEQVWRADWDQRTVESAQIGFALWQTRDRIWSKMSSTERARVVGFLDLVGQRPAGWQSNWALFWVLNHTARKALKQPYDQTIIDEVLTAYLDGVYCGDGWYDDADKRGSNYFDNYITWVFATHVLAWAAMDGAAKPVRRDELLERVRAWMQHYPYFFAADGATCEYGRSLAYKFARLGAPLWAYKLGVFPHSAGMLKRLVGKHLRWYVERGAIRADGTLRQSLTAHGSAEIIEPYISTGATYWAMQAFSGLWSLADDDPFWTVEEEPLPSEQADFIKAYPQPGWVLTAYKGHVQHFNAGTVKPDYGGKYAKLVYSSGYSFNVGLPSLDSCLYLIEGEQHGQREKILAYAVDDSGWLRTRSLIYTQEHQHRVDTIIIALGAFHIRAHRLTLDPDAKPVKAIEGSAPLGYNGDESPVSRTDNGWLLIELAGRMIGMKSILGYSPMAHAVEGNPNSIHQHNLLAVLEAAPVNQQHDLICMVYAGETADFASLPTLEYAGWDAEGRFTVKIDEQTLSYESSPGR